MKVLDLHCAHGHRFEGWFGSEDDFLAQNGRGQIVCPVCGDATITRLPSAPRLNLSGASEPAPATTTSPPAPPAAQAVARPVDLQAGWMQVVKTMIARTEDVGERFAEEARRIHYGEAPERAIRGQATPEEREALREEGIETVAIPVPEALKGPVQ